ncbi:MAG: dihydrolipoamide acetyltransferase family protein [Desulfobacterales bacterium]
MARTFKLPDLGEGIHEGEVLAVLVTVGDTVREGDPILEVETDKAAVEIPSPVDGTVAEIRVKPGDLVKVGDVLMTFETDTADAAAESPAADEPAASPRTPPETPDTGGKRKQPPVPASPATRRLARELGVDLYAVTASGPQGLVTAQDVQALAAKDSTPGPGETAEAAAAAGPPEAPVLPDFDQWGATERIPLRAVRKSTARRMALAWSQIPHVHTQDQVDLTQLEALRRKHREAVAAQGGRLTLTVFALKAAAAALKRFPDFNASLDAAAGEIVRKHYFHIGVAVDTDDGLIVPVVRDVDRKSLRELAVELADLVDRTRRRKATREELQGATFTLTNVGPLGGGHFSAIINPPQVAIMGMGAARLEPVVLAAGGGPPKIVPRLLMPLVVCVDHRVLDGADAIRFMLTIKSILQDPEELLMAMT